MIVTRVAATPDPFSDAIGYLAIRAAAVTLPAPDGPLRVIGMYVPSRDASPDVTEILTSLCARLHGRRAAADRAGRAVAQITGDAR